MPRIIGHADARTASFEGAKDYRERYQALIGPSFGACPSCHQGRMLAIEILPRSPHRKPAIADNPLIGFSKVRLGEAISAGAILLRDGEANM